MQGLQQVDIKSILSSFIRKIPSETIKLKNAATEALRGKEYHCGPCGKAFRLNLEGQVVHCPICGNKIF